MAVFLNKECQLTVIYHITISGILADSNIVKSISTPLPVASGEIIVIFIDCYMIKSKIHGRLEIWNLSSHVEKYRTHSALIREIYFSTLENKFHISMRPCNIFYL